MSVQLSVTLLSSIASGLAIAGLVAGFKHILNACGERITDRRDITCNEALKAASMAMDEGNTMVAVHLASLALEFEIKKKCGPDFDNGTLRKVLKRFEEEKVINRSESFNAARLLSIRNELIHRGNSKTKIEKIRSSVDSVSTIVGKIEEINKCPM